MSHFPFSPRHISLTNPHFPICHTPLSPVDVSGILCLSVSIELTLTLTRVFAYAPTAEPTVPAGEYRLVMQRELEALGGPVIKLHSLRNVPHAEGRAQKGVSIKMWLAGPISPICRTTFLPYLRI